MNKLSNKSIALINYPGSYFKNFADALEEIGFEIFWVCPVKSNGGGASNYQDNDAFLEAGIKLISQNYVTKPYGDIEKFIPGLSIIDWLMNRPNI